MWQDPELILLSFPLIGAGSIEFGYAKQGGGMTVGTAPMMGRINVPANWGHYPNCWFKIQNQYGIHKLKGIFKEDEPNYIPDWLRADCYEGAYYRLVAEKENDKTGNSGSP